MSSRVNLSDGIYVRETVDTRDDYVTVNHVHIINTGVDINPENAESVSTQATIVLESDTFTNFGSSCETLQETSSLSRNRWDTIDLGLIQTIFTSWCINLSPRVAIILSITCTIVFSLLDNSSDFYIACALFIKGDWIYGGVVIICDYIPGWQLAIHNMCSEKWHNWKNYKQKMVTILFLVISPLSLPLFFLQWVILFSSADQETFDYLHHNARLSQLLNGSVESPLQVMILFILWGEGKLNAPWTTYTEFEWRRNNIYLGAVPGILSLIISLVVILKGALDIVESTSTKEKVFVCGYALCNFVFRLTSYALAIMYFKEMSVILFLAIAIVNVTIIFRYDKPKRKDISVVTSAIISMFTPFVSSVEPHRFQLIDDVVTQEEAEEHTRHKKILSSKMAIVTWVLIIISDLLLLVLLMHNSFHYSRDIVLTRDMTKNILYILIFPVGISALIASICFKRGENNDANTDEIGTNQFSLKKVLDFFKKNMLTGVASLKNTACLGVVVAVLILVITCISAGIIFGGGIKLSTAHY